MSGIEKMSSTMNRGRLFASFIRSFFVPLFIVRNSLRMVAGTHRNSSKHVVPVSSSISMDISDQIRQQQVGNDGIEHLSVCPALAVNVIIW